MAYVPSTMSSLATLTATSNRPLLEISPHTVTTYVKKIYQKLPILSRGEAVYEASKMGLIE